MLYVTLKENTNNETVRRAYGAGSVLVDYFLYGVRFFSLQLALYKLKLRNLKIRQEQRTKQKQSNFSHKVSVNGSKLKTCRNKCFLNMACYDKSTHNFEM